MTPVTAFWYSASPEATASFFTKMEGRGGRGFGPAIGSEASEGQHWGGVGDKAAQCTHLHDADQLLEEEEGA